MRRARSLAVLGLWALGACGGADSSGTAGPPSASSTGATGETAPPPLEPVVATALAEVAGRVDFLGPLVLADEELAGKVRGLTEYVAYSSDDRTRQLGLDELTSLGTDAAAALRDVALDPSLIDLQRDAAIEALLELGGGAAALALLEPLEFGEPPWIRTRCAWRLGQLGDDRAIPTLIKRLKYEKDEEAAVWIAWALGQMGNLGGLSAQLEVRRRENAQHLWPTIDGHLGEQMQRYDTDVDGLWSLWNSAPSAALAAERSDAWLHVIWHWIQRLDEYQLRGVDDARFIFSNLGPAAVAPLAAALRDESRYIRLHAAQCLQRMGARARGSTGALIAALAQPDLAAQAAEALGAIGGEGVRPALVDHLRADRDPALRLAAARALGALGEADAVESLRLHGSAASFPELEQAVAESLAFLGRGDEVAAQLCRMRTDPTLEPATSERALRHWLASRAADGDDEANALVGQLDDGDAPWSSIADLARAVGSP